ncbi:MAG: adenylate/guanylate cyclase domain-containing protein [Chitinophagaceae bacterium]
MEADIAILIADLSGYTALTETHGAMAAADLIEKYREIVNRSLAGDCQVHQYTGDEVVIVSSSADDLAITAALLLHHTTGEENFLQVHGGLHYGKILKRNNNYFGTTINFASRIAGKAQPGKFWCSADYTNALSDRSRVDVESKGVHSFKNLAEERELFELKMDLLRKFHIDPVCRMVIHDTTQAVSHPAEPVYFCSAECYESYVTRNP